MQPFRIASCMAFNKFEQGNIPVVPVLI